MMKTRDTSDDKIINDLLKLKSAKDHDENDAKLRTLLGLRLHSIQLLHNNFVFPICGPLVQTCYVSSCFCYYLPCTTFLIKQQRTRTKCNSQLIAKLARSKQIKGPLDWIRVNFR